MLKGEDWLDVDPDAFVDNAVVVGKLLQIMIGIYYKRFAYKETYKSNKKILRMLFPSQVNDKPTILCIFRGLEQWEVHER